MLAGRRLNRGEFRVPALATTELTGVRVLQVRSQGKHQLFRFDNEMTPHPSPDGWHMAHLQRRASLVGRARLEIRSILATAEHDAVGYRLPVIELIPTINESDVVGHLGPDLLGPDWDPEEAARRISTEPERTIGEALLDQRNLAGIGTFYRAEVLFLQGLHPRTPVAEVKNLTRLVQRSHQLLYANRWRPEQATTGDLRPGRRTYVYEREREPCRRCGTPIQAETFGPLGQERRSFWCPRCQPLIGRSAGS